MVLGHPAGESAPLEILEAAQTGVVVVVCSECLASDVRKRLGIKGKPRLPVIPTCETDKQDTVR